MWSNPIVRFLGSIKLAVPVLSIIIIVLIGATFYESQVGSTTVQQEIYKSPWFGALMLLLALNLGVSALSRYPWRSTRKIGFALTHLGLIVIIAGSAAVIHLGVEGMLLVRTDSSANNQIRVEGELLEVMQPGGTLQQANVFVKPDGSVTPQSFAGLSLLDYSENTIKTVRFSEGATVENPAVRLSLTSERMGQRLERFLAIAPVAYRQIPLGIAELEIIQVDSQSELQKLLSPPLAENYNPWGIIQVKSNNGIKNLDVEKTLNQLIQLGENFQIKVVSFFPDFRLDANNQPTTLSQTLNNPAVQLEVSSESGLERWFLFGRDNFEPIRTVVSGEAIEELAISYKIKPRKSEDYFQVIVTDEGELYYTAKSSKGFKSGTLAIGQAISPGWADFKITVEEFIPHANLNREVVPVSDSTVPENPALLVKTAAGTETWLPWGEPTTIAETTGDSLAAFSPKILELPFAIKLEDFIVERNEGSDSVAMWTSKIRINDSHNSVVKYRNVWMNHPTWYQGWKIAQASWNPGDLKQSTLQVKREPAWVTALTWIGSALVILGIGVMFYGSAIVKKLGYHRRDNQQQSESETLQPTATETQELVVSR
ncbi:MULTISPECIES: cytochrome c biogenesis protein ResB [unclassified Coleofasciculus]|uniref:cytochrome c biogenesis protein ResB n=1 Tax=unclassified Coleofasciculus TaxID=2692782 RepID=UPI0018804AAD|nr:MULTISPECIES: cytochrome c biogenesis protein ResB [unclassified Coleofasciculus]MBE9127179.1 cytochrome c biogenesis protein ResB [Coleofasciculus sp. LEGE 07081]MBE9150500.1 cytochrome c biogenesis protein ResB [Coleofasciculus sp. LEGE 07092]